MDGPFYIHNHVETNPVIKRLNCDCLYFQFVWVVAFLATVLLDVDLGLLVAVLFGIITIVARSQR